MPRPLGRPRGSSHHGFDPGDHGIGVKWLGEEVLPADQTDDLGGHLGLSRDDDHGSPLGLGSGPKLSEHSLTADIRHHQVEHDGVWMMHVQQQQSLESVLGLDDVVVVHLKGDLDELADGVVVLHQKHPLLVVQVSPRRRSPEFRKSCRRTYRPKRPAAAVIPPTNTMKEISRAPRAAITAPSLLSLVGSCGSLYSMDPCRNPRAVEVRA